MEDRVNFEEVREGDGINAAATHKIGDNKAASEGRVAETATYMKAC